MTPLGTPVDPEDHIGPAADTGVADTAQSDLQQLHTTGSEGADVDAGWRIDARTTGTTTDLDIHDSIGAGDSVSPGQGRDMFYQDSWHTTGQTQYGWVRGPGDVRSTMLWDHPHWNRDNDFDFETAAVGADNAMVYGVLKWGFSLENGQVSRPYARAEDHASATFSAAMDRFRAHYAHEPIVVYFDTNSDTPTGAEQAKVDQAIAYLTANPDMEVSVEGYADYRGSEADNQDLAARRRSNIEIQFEDAGIDFMRISFSSGDEETTQFGDQGALKDTAGNLQANRRAVLRFERSTP
jgi:outer membrane protein OmpA-like peptidoglycan-associated protein